MKESVTFISAVAFWTMLSVMFLISAPKEDNIYYFSDPINAHTVSRLITEIRGGKIQTLRLSSQGGSIIHAERLAFYIHAYEVNTFVGSEDFCLSACALLLLSGNSRELKEGGSVGLHSSYVIGFAYSDSGRDEVIRFGQEESLAELTVALSFIEPEYHLPFINLRLRAHRNSTKTDMYWATGQELRSAGIID